MKKEILSEQFKRMQKLAGINIKKKYAMESDMRKLIDQVKNFRKSPINEHKINENIFQCNIEELYKSVLEYVNAKLNYPKDSIKVELKDNNYVLISHDYSIKTDISWNSLDDNSKIRKLQQHMNSFEKNFSHFKDFCNKDIKGIVSTFKKDITVINIHSSIQLDMVKMVQPDKNNLRRYDESVFRYSENGVSELSKDKNSYVKRYGDSHLDRVYVSVGLFLKTIN